MTNLTADQLIKSISPSVMKGGNIVETIAKATGGKAVSDAMVAKVGTTLTTKLSEHLPETEKKTQTITTLVKRIKNILSVSTQLDAIVTASREVYAGDEKKTGNAYLAMLTGVKVAVSGAGNNEVIAAINDYAGVVDEKEVALKAIATAFKSIEKQLSAAGHKSKLTQVKALKSLLV